MAQKFDILIFSIFGRNHWLASQLKSAGHSVALMDLTSLFQKGLAEDWEGPYPLIFPDHVARSYSQSFTDQDRSELLHRGPSLRIKGRGLLEFKSDHIEYMLNRMDQKGIWVSEEEGRPLIKTSEHEFKDLWLKSFLKQWRSTTLRSLRTADDTIQEFPLNSNYVLRSPSRRGYVESADWLKDSGVEVINPTSWWRCEFNQGQWEFNLDQSDITIHASKFILGLTSYELQKFSGQLKAPDFETVQPQAFWVRWRGLVSNPTALNFIPSYSMYLSDPEFGVYNENFFTVIKRSQTEIDIWACLSAEALAQLDFQNGIRKHIEDKLGQFVPELKDIQTEDLRMGSDLFSFWPVYKNRSSVHQLKSTLYIDSPESWLGLDNYSRYLSQTQLIENLNKERIQNSVSKSK